MLSHLNNYIFYIENALLNNNKLKKEYLKFINRVPMSNCYFFTHDCDISKRSLYKTLISNGVSCDFDNILTPTYLLLDYCKNLYDNFTIYPISTTKDLDDFHLQNIRIDYDNPSLIFISTTNITKDNLKTISELNVPLVFSSNLCANRFYNCNMCNKDCSLKYIKTFYANRIITPDLPPLYSSMYLFKRLNIKTKNTIVIADFLRDDYIQFQRLGCNLILLLTNKFTFDDYLKSPYDANLVIDSFENLLYFLNLKEEV